MKERNVIISIILIFSLACYFGVAQIKDDITSVFSKNLQYEITYIIDAGHGGEDGGAVAHDGTLEKDINLQIAKRISYIFDIFGLNYVMIRTDDVSVGDTSLGTIRERKVSDINSRYDIINSYDNSILISIHQNFFPDSKYSGCQVFYSENNNESETLARLIQTSVISSVQHDNTRKIKPSDDSIFLLYKAKCPSVMIECGFLSNANELCLLKDSQYQNKLAYVITSAVIDYNNLSKGWLNGTED